MKSWLFGKDAEIKQYRKAMSLIKKNSGIVFKQHTTNNSHSLVLPNATYSPWLQDHEFLSIYQAVKDYTLVDAYRLYELYSLCGQVENIDGDILEVGVWRGGSGMLLASIAEKMNKKVYLADTFAGVVKSSSKDATYNNKEHADTSEAIVQNLASKLNLHNVIVLKGVFPEQTSNKLDSIKLSFVHIDVDVYQSGLDVWNFIQPHLSKGSIIVFDDFGFITCSGVTQLVNELKSQTDYYFIHNLNGHAVFIKK
jgi:O-methyltransferase